MKDQLKHNKNSEPAEKIVHQQQEIKEANLPKRVEQIQSYKLEQSNKGVCYLSRIPPYMKPNYIRKLLQTYGVQRIYLLQQSQWLRKNRLKHGGNKRICFQQGWVQFSDKRMAKLAATCLNGQKMVPKKNTFYSQDVWNMKYLPKFKWHHLTQRLAHQQRTKKQQLKMQLQQQKKIEQFYSENIFKSRQMRRIIEKKTLKGRQLKTIARERSFEQTTLVKGERDQ